MKKREKKMDKNRDKFKQILKLIADREYNQEQLVWIENFRSPDERIVKLSGDRASGRSSIGLTMITVDMIIHPGITTAVFCKPIVAQSHLRYVSSLIERFAEPFDFNPIIRRTKYSIELDNGSRLLVVNSANHLRGCTMKDIFFDMNVKSIEDIDQETFACIIPMIATSRSGKILVSTEK